MVSCEWNMREAVSQKIYYSKYWLCDAALHDCQFFLSLLKICPLKLRANAQKLFINGVCCVSMVQWPLPLTSTPVKSSFDPTWLYFLLDMAMWLIKANQVKRKVCLGQQISVIKISLSRCKGLFQDFWFQLQKFPVLILLWHENNGFLPEDMSSSTSKGTLISSFCM